MLAAGRLCLRFHHRSGRSRKDAPELPEPPQPTGLAFQVGQAAVAPRRGRQHEHPRRAHPQLLAAEVDDAPVAQRPRNLDRGALAMERDPTRSEVLDLGDERPEPSEKLTPSNRSVVTSPPSLDYPGAPCAGL